jgi:hypothetical protein
MSDAYETALVERIEAAEKEKQKQTYGYYFQQGLLSGLQDALAQYRAFKAQDAPDFKVGDRVRSTAPPFPDHTGEIVKAEVRYFVRWDHAPDEKIYGIGHAEDHIALIEKDKQP